MTLENAIMAAVTARLGAVGGLSGVSIVQGNGDEVLTVPRIAVEATREAVAIPGYALYGVKLEVVVTANAWEQAQNGTSGNAEVENLFALVEGSLTGDLTELTDADVIVHGARWDGGVSDLRQNRTISRTWTITLMASPLTD